VTRFAVIPAAAVLDTRLSLRELSVLSALGLHTDKAGWCYPSSERLGELLGVSGAMVRRSIGTLQACGYVEIRPRTNRDGGRASNLIRVLFDAEIPAQFLRQVAPPPQPGVTAPATPEVTGVATSGVTAPATPQVAGTIPLNAPMNSTTAAAPPSRGINRQEDPWHAELKAAYPKRAGNPNWHGAWKAARARLKEGHTVAEFLAGARRYAAYIRATGKEGTEYVQQASTFLGPSKPFLLPWDPPAAPEDPKRAAERERAQAAERREWEDLKARASKVGFRPPRESEALPVYRTLVQRAEWDARDKPRLAGPVAVGAALAQVRRIIGKDGGEAAEGAG
jgi:biotin operon repressor